MKLEVQRKGPGYGDVETILNELGRKSLRIGVVGPRARQVHRDRDGGSSGLTTAALAAVHEFGIGVPERSFMRSTVNEKLRAMRAIYGAGMRRVAQGRSTTDEVLERIGERVSAEMRRRLLAGISPPLSERTLNDPDRDPRGLPLVDTEQILEAVGFEIEEGPG